MVARVGISGWTYPPWRGDFYPPGLPHRLELPYAAERLTSIEINGSFYALQRPSSYRSWREQVGPDFVFSVKAGRFITHMKRLRDVEVPVANFFGSGVLALGEKLGPILWQLPPTLAFDASVVGRFLHGLPRSTAEAGYLARAHDDRMTGRLWTGSLPDRPLRHAIEVRHNSFASAEAIELFRQAHVAVVVADTAGRWPALTEVTADFVYVRLHGAEELYTSGYDEPALLDWAAKIRAWTDRGLDVYVYFDNDVKVRAPYDAISLLQLLRTEPAIA
jgi:uncharacterized protein YecE (DUF72 family)